VTVDLGVDRAANFPQMRFRPPGQIAGGIRKRGGRIPLCVGTNGGFRSTVTCHCRAVRTVRRLGRSGSPGRRRVVASSVSLLHPVSERPIQAPYFAGRTGDYRAPGHPRARKVLSRRHQSPATEGACYVYHVVIASVHHGYLNDFNAHALWAVAGHAIRNSGRVTWLQSPAQATFDIE
jgi:hypothetical protein